MIHSSLFKKIAFPLAGFIALSFLLLVTGKANAIFDLSRNNLRATGTIVDIGNDTFTMDTGGSEPPFDVVIVRQTNFRRPLQNINDLEIGDEVDVRARIRSAGVFEASRIELVEDADYGYGSGTSCERLRVSRAVVLSSTPSEVVVRRNNIDITVSINDDTRIRGYRNNRRVDVGDTVDIRGEDCGSAGFVADRIVIRRPNVTENDDNHDSDNEDEDESES